MFEVSKYVKQLGNFQSIESLDQFLYEQHEKTQIQQNLNQQINQNLINFQLLYSSREQITQLHPQFKNQNFSIVSEKLQSLNQIQDQFKSFEIQEQKLQSNLSETNADKELSSILDYDINLAVKLILKYENNLDEQVQLSLKIAKTKFFAQNNIMPLCLFQQLLKSKSPFTEFNELLTKSLNNLRAFSFEENQFLKQMQQLDQVLIDENHLKIVQQMLFIEIYIGEIIIILLIIRQLTKQYVELMETIMQKKFVNLDDIISSLTQQFDLESFEQINRTSFSGIFFNSYQFNQKIQTQINMFKDMFAKQYFNILNILQIIINNTDQLNIDQANKVQFQLSTQAILQYLLDFIVPFIQQDDLILNEFMLLNLCKINQFICQNSRYYIIFKTQIEELQQKVINKIAIQTSNIIIASSYFYYQFPQLSINDIKNINMNQIDFIYLLQIQKLQKTSDLSIQVQFLIIGIEQLAKFSESCNNMQSNNVYTLLQQSYVSIFNIFLVQVEIIVQHYHLYHSQLRIAYDINQKNIIQNIIDLNFSKSYIPKESLFFKIILVDLEILFTFVFPLTCIIYCQAFNLRIKQQFQSYYQQFANFQIQDIIQHFLTITQNFFKSTEFIPSKQISSLMGQQVNNLFLANQGQFNQQSLIQPYDEIYNTSLVILTKQFEYTTLQVSIMHSNSVILKLGDFTRSFVKRVKQTPDLTVSNRQFSNFTSIFSQLHEGLTKEVERWIGLRDLTIIINQISGFKFTNQNDLSSAITGNIPIGPWSEPQIVVFEIIIGVLCNIYSFESTLHCLVKRDNGRIEQYNPEIINKQICILIIQEIVKYLKGFQE
ncbi:hypothetical protein SS50377_23315 [Spironucleus salmonicida]|uniref:Uncharacterized protein n=1 Tax=Spironucleus salmonicida TaxID=348837 RepID=V6M1W8_9EUKA|nr:hypothetical protein SS50377_23315 [Spironucleus salmonicida]|eukprot:EST47184.1 Hypothetical protein SS50377_12695 [Spironucleus salmonicida]